MTSNDAARPDFLLTLITNDHEWLRAGDAAGVDRIGIDIERISSADVERRAVDGRISDHRIDDMQAVSATLQHAKPFIRINRLHANTRTEIEQALSMGARSIMFPGFRTKDEVEQFLEWVDGRAEAILLLETAPALKQLPDWLTVPGVTEVFVGMNDLHLELKMASAMDLLASEVLQDVSDTIRGAGVRFGFGGVARPDCEDLPVPADLVLASYARLQGQAAWIARSFFRGGLTPQQFGAAIVSLRARLNYWFRQSRDVLDEAGARLSECVARKKP